MPLGRNSQRGYTDELWATLRFLGRVEEERMGVDATLYRVHKNGTSTRRWRLERLGDATDLGDVMAMLPETHPGRVTSRIKPYGSLVLYPAEMTELVEDLERIKVSLARRDHAVIDAFITLARQCATEPESELRLDGD